MGQRNVFRDTHYYEICIEMIELSLLSLICGNSVIEVIELSLLFSDLI